jgi:hypothetical protein
MLIDPTDNETAVGLLFSHNLCDSATTEICYVGDFVDDANDLVRSEAVLKVKTAMELGHTVILVNSGPIHSCFYDVFNRHFTLLSVGGKPDLQREQPNLNVTEEYPVLFATSVLIFFDFH